MREKTLEVLVVSVMIEATMTYVNQVFVNNNFSWDMFLSILLGIVISVVYGIDLPKYFDMKSKIPYVGNVLTGILISRGFNYIYDLLIKIIYID